MSKKVGGGTRFKRFAKQSLRMMSERINRQIKHKLPLEPLEGWPDPVHPKARKPHKDRM